MSPLSTTYCSLRFSDADLGMHEIISKLLRYMATGGIAAVADVGGFAFLIDAQLNVLIAGIASFWAAALVNYLLTSQFVFGRTATAHGFALFLFAALIGLTVNIGITMLGVYLLTFPPTVAKLVGVGTAFLINFGLNMLFVFPQKRILKAPRDGSS
jgi:putative flippase GtrA